MKIVTAAEMREIDRLTTAQYGVSSLTLMENAGTAVAEFAQKHFDFDSACVVCGKGNNGGDGFVAARKLKEAGKQVSVIILVGSREELRGDAAEMFQKLPVTPFWASEESDFNKAEVQQALHADLIVDAILGTGFSPPLKGIAARTVELINHRGAPVVAVDVPSGTDADVTSPSKGDLAVQADAVITFTAPKPAHVFGELTRGAMAVSEIGTPPQCVFLNSQLKQQVMVAPLVADVFPRRRPESHKGDFGHVLVIGGSLGKAGAAGMAGMAALHSGAGLVTVASPESVQPTVAAIAPELMTEALAETEEGSLSMQAIPPIEELRKGKDTIVLGPGLSRNRETAEAVRQLLPIFRGGVTVLDADGLNAFEHHAGQLHTEGILVLTPHPGEMSRISGLSTEEVQKDRIGTA
ncbi:MAG: NAD(P)H-hydrate epimerase, partial [Candidatus Angelobacter sp.]